MQLNKKGFVLMETIIVMTVLSIALIYLYTTYVKVLASASKVSYYDNVEDMYVAYYAMKYKDSIPNNIPLDSSLRTNLNIENIIYLSKEEVNNLYNSENLLKYDGGTINYLNSIKNNVGKKCNVEPCLTIVKIKRNNKFYFAKYENYKN